MLRLGVTERGGAWYLRGMVQYSLSHLTQGARQEVLGPIQDDEALLLFALIRVTRVRRILEVGGLNGYSATNFLAATGPEGRVYTVDLNPVQSVGENHIVIQKDASLLTSDDVGQSPLDLVFFDCHVLGAQLALFWRLFGDHIITPDTYIAVHDTGLHPAKRSEHAYAISDGYVHQRSEREMVNMLHQAGYDAIPFHITGATEPDLPFRHGVTLLRKFRPLDV